MSHPALIEAVHRQTAETIAAVWAEARAEAARCRDDAQRGVDAKRTELTSRLQTISAAARQAALADAERRARAIRALARSGLADRMWTVARGAVRQLRDASSATHFRARAAELPARAWTRVVVNPADGPLARDLFQGCVVETDATLSGGIIADADGLRVTNTLDRRLAAAWPDLQPMVWNDVIAHHAHPQPVA